MKRQIIADRKDELEFFRAMVAGKTSTRILLIQAMSGKGKTTLLHRFAQECADNVCLIRLDLKGAEKGIAQVMGVFRDKLGVAAFPHFQAELVRLAPSVNVSNNTVIFGKMDVAIVLNTDEQTRKIRLEMLEAAFFEDLRGACTIPIVAIFDSFEKASTDLQNWLSGGFLSHISHIPHICVVISGQCVPKRTLEEWEEVCERRELHDIEDVEAWFDFVRENKWTLERSAVRAIVLAFRGIPREVSNQLFQMRFLEKAQEDTLSRARLFPDSSFENEQREVKIFLSYARPDREKVELIYQKLKVAGFVPWMDSQDILPGERWENSIQLAQHQADFVLVLISSNSVDRRGFLQKEIRQALEFSQEKLDTDIYLIPVRLEDCPVPGNLTDYQWVDLFKQDGWDRLLKAIQVELQKRK